MPSYRHLIGGCVGDVPHEVGDVVDPTTDRQKLDEWLAAGVIAMVETPKRTRKARDEHHDNDNPDQ